MKKKVMAILLMVILFVIDLSTTIVQAVTYTDSVVVTTVPITINDEGASANFTKKVSLDNFISYYNYRGTEEIIISYSLRIDAINEGTQYVQFYDDNPTLSTSNKIYSKAFYVSASSGYVTYNVTAAIDIDDFKQTANYFYIGFDASGWLEDDWNLDDMTVNISLEHEVYNVNYDSFDEAYDMGSVGYGKSITMYLNVGLDYDYLEYEISPSMSGAYNVYSEYTSSNLDTYGWVYEWQGLIPFDYKELLGSDDNSGEGNNFRLEFDSLDAYENYFVKVRPAFSTLSGSTKIVFEANYDELYTLNNGEGYLVAREGLLGDEHRTYFTQEATKYLYLIAYTEAHEDIINAYLNYDPINGEDATTAIETAIIAAIGIIDAPVGIILTAIQFLANFIEENPYDFDSVELVSSIETLCNGRTYLVYVDGQYTLGFAVDCGFIIKEGTEVKSIYPTSSIGPCTTYEAWTNHTMHGEYLQRWQLIEYN